MRWSFDIYTVTVVFTVKCKFTTTVCAITFDNYVVIKASRTSDGTARLLKISSFWIISKVLLPIPTGVSSIVLKTNYKITATCKATWESIEWTKGFDTSGVTDLNTIFITR